MVKQLSVLLASAVLITSCGRNSLPTPTASSGGLHTQRCLPEDPECIPIGGGGDGDPTPAPYVVHPIQELYTRANLLGVSPASAAVSNAVESAPALTAQGFPTGSSSPQNFITRLFSQIGWVNPNSTPVIGVSTSDPSCTNTPVEVNSATEWFVGINGIDPNFFVGATIQGATINGGPGSTVPIYMPSGKRANINLTASFPAPMQAGVVPTLGDVNSAISTILTSAPADMNGEIFFDSAEANSTTEASYKLGIKGTMGTIQAAINAESTTTDNRSMVFATLFQAQYYVDISLPQRPIVEGLMNNVTTADLEGLGNDGVLGYDNLPTYIQRVVYGRRLIFSVSSNVSSSELKQTVDLAFGSNANVNLSNHQKNVLSASNIHVYSYGGPYSATAAAIKDGSYKSFFNAAGSPAQTMLPIGYDIRRWDGPRVKMYTPFKYTQRVCNPYKRVVLNFTDMRGSAEVYVLNANNTPVFAGSIDRNGSIDLTDKLRDGPNSVRVNSISTQSSGLFGSYGRSINIDVQADDVSVLDPGKVSCSSCHSGEAYKFNINRTTGTAYMEN